MRTAQSDLKSWLWTVLLVLVIACAPADAETVDPAQVQSGSLLLRMADGYRSATLLNLSLIHI